MLAPQSADALREPTINNHGDGPQNTKFDSGDQMNNNAGGAQINNSKFFLFNSPTAKSRSITEAEEKQACLDSLSFPRFGDRYDEITTPHKHTCEWLFHTLEFERWRHRMDLPSHNGVLWIKGKPGTGKSTLMKHTLRYCRENFQDHLILAYFFHARGNQLEKTALGMFRTLLYQAVDNNVVPYGRFHQAFLRKLKLHKGWNWEWGESEIESFMLSEMLLEAKESQPKPLLLLIDALDECRDPEVRNVVEFLEKLSVEAIKSGVTLSICLSSRHFPNVAMDRSLVLVVEKNMDHDEDIARYVREKLRNTAQRRQGEDIQVQILEKASGIFLWVVIVVALLNKAYDEGDYEAMQKTLNTVPENLEEIFTTVLDDGRANRAETIRMLQWVLLAMRPLSPDELYFAAMTREESTSIQPWNQEDMTPEFIENRIITSSKGLIQIRKGIVASVQFIHQSVNDFLYRTHGLQELDETLGPNPTGTSHARLWACCRSYLDHFAINSMSIEQVNALPHQYPFILYAMVHVLSHAEEAASRGIERDSIACWLQQKDVWFERWKTYLGTTLPSQRYAYLRHRQSPGLLYVLSFEGYQTLTEILLDEKHGDLGVQGSEFGNALQAAAAGGKRGIVQTLLKNGFDINAQGGLYCTALQAAAAMNEMSIVGLLLENKADVDAQGGVFGSALQAAAYRGDVSIVRELLDKGANINAGGGIFGNALQAASAGEDGYYQETAELLLRRGADVKAQGGFFGTALQAAAICEKEKLVEILLDKAADVDAHEGIFGSALQIASGDGNEDIAQQLLDHGADVNKPGGMMGSALQAAASGSRKDMVQLLLDKGASVSAQGGLLGSALHYAVMEANKDIVRILLGKGADILAHDYVHGSVLHAAAMHHDSTEIFQLLLSNGADVNAQGGLYGSVLQTAMLQGRNKAFQLLLENGAVLNPETATCGHSIQPDIVRKDTIISPEASFEGDKHPSSTPVSEEDNDLCTMVGPDTPNELDTIHTDPGVIGRRKMEVFEMRFKKARADNAEEDFSIAAFWLALAFDEKDILLFLFKAGLASFWRDRCFGSIAEAMMVYPVEEGDQLEQLAMVLSQEDVDIGAVCGPIDKVMQLAVLLDNNRSSGKPRYVDLLLEKGCQYHCVSSKSPATSLYLWLAIVPFLACLGALWYLS